MRKGLAVLLVLVVMLPCIIGSANAWGYEVISSGDDGVGKNDFVVGETVYAHAHTSDPSGLVDIYVVNNKEGWKLDDLLSDVSGSVETNVSTDTNGWIPVTAIWTPGSGDVGDYDIVLDANQNGKLDDGDLVDHDMEIGFSVTVPEFATIAIPVASILGLLFFFNHRKRKKE